MKKIFPKIHSLVSHSVLAGALCMTLASCSNFLSGGEFKEQLEGDISYAESDSYEIHIECDEGTGSITSIALLSKKVTDEFYIEFKAASGVQFIGWKAYAKTNGGVQKELSDEYITFVSYNKESSDGTFKATVKLMKGAEGITIKPVCILLPKIKSYRPEQSQEGAYANTPIKVTFNMPMEDESTEEGSSAFSYENISIMYGSTAMSEYFDAPTFSSDKTVLTFQPHGNDLHSFITAKNVAFIDLDITFGEKIAVTREGTTLGLSKDASSIKVRYKNEIETTPPSKYDFFSAADELTLENAASVSSEKHFTQKNLGTFENSDILRNRTNGTVYLYGRYYDADSGVQTVRITERRTNAKDGSAAAGTILTKEYTSDNAEFSSDGNGNTVFCIKYELESNDGAILLTSSVIDACGNEADAQTFTAIKDSGIDLGGVELYNFKPYRELHNYYFTEDGKGDGTIIQYDDWPSIVRNVRLAPVKKQIYKDCYVSESDLKTVSISYNSVSHNMNYNSDSEIWNYVINDVSDISGLALTLTIEDDFGHSATKNFSFPDVPDLVNIQPDPTYDYMFKAYFSTKADVSKIVSVFDIKFSETIDGPAVTQDKLDDFTFPETREYIPGTEDSMAINMYTANPSGYKGWHGDCYYAVYSNYRFFFMNGYLAGLMTDEIDTSEVKEVDSSLPPVVIKEVTRSLNDDASILNLHVTMDTTSSNPWNTYSTVLVQFAINPSSPMYTIFVDKDDTDFDISIPYTSKIFMGFHYLKLIGITDSNTSPDYPYPLQYLTDASGWYELSAPFMNPEIYEKVAPVINNDPSGGPQSVSAVYESNPLKVPARYDYMVPVIARDYESGLKKIVVTVNGKTWAYSESNLLSFDNNEHLYYDDDDGHHFDSSSDHKFPPIWDADQNVNNLKIQYYDAYNNCAEWSGTYTSLKLNSLRWNLNNADDYVFQTKSDTQLYKWCLGIAKWDSSTNSWIKAMNDVTTQPLEAFYNNSYAYQFADGVALPADSFLKVYATAASEDSNLTSNFGHTAPVYIYTGSTKNSGEFDYLLKNGSSKSSVLIASDAPTFVHTIVTKHPLAECQDWSVDEWEHNHKHFGDKLMDFSTNPTARKYTIPVDSIDTGDCYVVIAHFADGTTVMSDVMVK